MKMKILALAALAAIASASLSVPTPALACNAQCQATTANAIGGGGKSNKSSNKSSSKNDPGASMGGWTGRGENERYLTNKEKKQLARAIQRGDQKKVNKLARRAQNRKAADVRNFGASGNKFGGASSSHGNHNPAGCGGGCQRSAGYD